MLATMVIIRGTFTIFLAIAPAVAQGTRGSLMPPPRGRERLRLHATSLVREVGFCRHLVNLIVRRLDFKCLIHVLRYPMNLYLT
ncbi:hypothetical protein HMPREF2978_11920 [Corynebacterium sp. HMSC074C01]|nr:hypothetical protein HMPREF2978_11920 [Corynebacterium sp. HMSC074C01]